MYEILGIAAQVKPFDSLQWEFPEGVFGMTEQALEELAALASSMRESPLTLRCEILRSGIELLAGMGCPVVKMTASLGRRGSYPALHIWVKAGEFVCSFSIDQHSGFDTEAIAEILAFSKKKPLDVVVTTRRDDHNQSIQRDWLGEYLNSVKVLTPAAYLNFIPPRELFAQAR